MKQNFPLIQQKTKKIIKNCQDYHKKFNFTNQSIIVDTATARFSSQKLIQNSLRQNNVNPLFVYWGIQATANTQDVQGYLENPQSAYDT